MSRRWIGTAWCTGLVLAVSVLGHAGEGYKCCNSFTPNGTVPDLGKMRAEVAKNYGDEYAGKVVEFLKVLDDPKDEIDVPVSQRLSVQFDVLYRLQSEGFEKVRSVSDFMHSGEIRMGKSAPSLRSGVDFYKVCFSLTQPWHVYVFQLDSTGKIDPIFPNQGLLPGADNPVERNLRYEVPGSPRWAYLDKNVGFEKIYVFVTQRSKPALVEQLYPYFIEAGRKIVDDKWVQGAVRPTKRDEVPPGKPFIPSFTPPQMVSVTTRGITKRGMGGATEVETHGFTLTYTPSVYMCQKSELVQTLWFHHTK